MSFTDHWTGYIALAVFLVARRDLDTDGDRVRLSKPIPRRR
jgi:hypothetical protein